jgi:GTP cyclohydrolase IA
VSKSQISRQDAEQAIKTLLLWIGEDPSREGLVKTPQRVIESFEEYFRGYEEKPELILAQSFADVSGYHDMVILRDIRFESRCEHHMAPIVGVAHVAYAPNKKVVGISKLARVVEAFAKRLQVQERLTVQIAQVIYETLDAVGAAVVIEADHHCMTTRGVHNITARMRTQSFFGNFQNSVELQQQFLQSLTK